MNRKTKLLNDYFSLDCREDQKAVLNTLDTLDARTPPEQKISADSFLLNGTGTLCEDAAIINETLTDHTIGEIAGMTHLDPKKVQERLTTMGMDPGCITQNKRNNRWTKDEETQLLSLNRDGLSTYAIGKVLERSSYACYKRLIYLGAIPNTKKTIR